MSSDGEWFHKLGISVSRYTTQQKKEWTINISNNLYESHESYAMWKSQHQNVTCCFSFVVQSLSPVSVQFSSVTQSCPTLCDPMTAAHQATLSITNSQSLLKLMSIEPVMPSNHLILCHPLLFLPWIFPNIRVFSSESVLCIRWPKYWSFSFSISQ